MMAGRICSAPGWIRSSAWNRLEVVLALLQASLMAVGRLGQRSKGGQFVAHVKALPGRPYDGHTLRTVLPEIEKFTGAALERVHVDDGYRGHRLGTRYKFKVFTSSQKPG